MHSLERVCTGLRHSAWLGQANWLWNRLRRPYNRILALFGMNGLERVMNGTDVLRVLPACRGIVESYEPEVWRQLMTEVQTGDVVTDVGAHLGLYSVAL